MSTDYGRLANFIVLREPTDGLLKLALTARELSTESKKVDTDPTEGQAEAGNYKKGHIKWHGLNLSIENPKGSTRSGVSKDGKKWSIAMRHWYGYIRGTRGADSDHVDFFLNDMNIDSELIFVVDQVDGESGDFDENKILIGWNNEESARAGYLANYSAGWQGLGSITPATLPDFKEWLEHGDKCKPYARAPRQSKYAGVRDMAGDEDTMLLPERHELQVVRGQGNHGVRSMETKLYGVHHRHGTEAEGHDLGARQGYQGLQSAELSMGDEARTVSQQDDQSISDTQRGNADSIRMGDTARGYIQRNPESASQRLDDRGGTDATGRNSNAEMSKIPDMARSDKVSGGLGQRDRITADDNQPANQSRLVSRESPNSPIAERSDAKDPEIVIDRPKGYQRTFNSAGGPINVTYPVNYGYLKGLVNPQDGEDTDVFVGSGGPHFGRYMKGNTTSGTWQPDEHKYYTGLTDDEHAAMLKFWHDQDPKLIQDHVAFPDHAALLADVRGDKPESTKIALWSDSDLEIEKLAATLLDLLEDLD